MESLRLTLKTLTPIWTGGIDRDSDFAREAGIIGTLRWWYEGIVRGLGKYACSPTSEETQERCKFDDKAYKSAIREREGKSVFEAQEEGLREVCPACRLFGCTGWARRFRIEVKGLETLPLFFVTHENVYLSNGNWLYRIFGGRREGRGTDTRFILTSKTLWSKDTFTVDIIPTHGDERTLDKVSYLLWLITTYGALGAKTQNGFGQVKIESGLNNVMIDRGRNLIREEVQRWNKEKGEDKRFDLSQFFSLMYEIKDPAQYAGVGRVIGKDPKDFNYLNHFIPCAFDIRYKSRARHPITGRGSDFGMRPFFRSKFKTKPKVTNLLLGETMPRSHEERAASRIHVSHLFKEKPDEKYKLKIWSHVPKEADVEVEEVVKAVKDFIAGDQGMFRGSILKHQYEYEKVLGEKK